MVALVCNAPTPNAQIPTPKVPRTWELEVGSWQLFESQALLSPRNWIDTREREQINHVEGLLRPAWQCGAPSLREVGRVIELQQADDHFADELRADACQSQAIRYHFRFLEHVVPQRRIVLEPEIENCQVGELTGRQGANSYFSGDRLTRGVRSREMP